MGVIDADELLGDDASGPVDLLGGRADPLSPHVVVVCNRL